MTTLPPFQRLIDDYGRGLHRFLVATIGPGDADDCYQETWLAALRAYPDVRDDSNLRGWLFTIAHRKAIDAARARKRRATPVAEP
ncbi:MAG: RNA polymerase sigma factor, partial [Solirubrobacteraceae bacterium]